MLRDKTGLRGIRELRMSKPDFARTQALKIHMGPGASYVLKLFWTRWHAQLTLQSVPSSILHKSIAGRYRPVSYPDGPYRPAIDLCRMLTGSWIFQLKYVQGQSLLLIRDCIFTNTKTIPRNYTLKHTLCHFSSGFIILIAY